MFILLGASLWGVIGWFVNHLSDLGFSSMEIVTLRAWSAAIMLLLYQLVTSASKLKLKSILDLKYFIGTGIFSIIFFNYNLFKAMELSTLPIATSLLYTAPAFVTIISFFVFNEPLTRAKIIALCITFLGTGLVVGVVSLDQLTMNYASILFGLGAGIGFAFYSIFTKLALEKYDSLTITTYTFVIAAIALTPFFPYVEKATLLTDSSTILYALGLGFLPTAFAYIIYTHGLNLTQASNASILSTVEPVVATLIGVFVFKEAFSFLQLIGMMLIIGAVILIQLSTRSTAKSNLPT